MSGRHRTRTRWTVAARRIVQAVCVAAAAVLIAASLPAGAAEAVPSSADELDSDGNVSVEVTEDTSPSSTPTPTPSRSPSPAPAQAPIRPGSTGGGTTTSTTTTTTGTATVAIIADPVSADGALVDAVVIDGILAMSGLSTQSSPSIFVGNGTFTVDFVIRNLSSTAFDSTATFWIDGAFGGRIAEIDGVAVAGFQPDETRRVQVRFEGLGQHILLHANATLSPPATLDGVELDPISRDSSALVLPWFSIALITGLGLLSWAGWWYYRHRVPVARLQPVGSFAQ